MSAYSVVERDNQEKRRMNRRTLGQGLEVSELGLGCRRTSPRHAWRCRRRRSNSSTRWSP